MEKPFTIRKALPGDIPELEELIALSARTLCSGDYTPEQIEASLGTAWGIDTELINDGTYFAVLADNKIIGCGGWSYRKTLFGSDNETGRKSEILNIETDSARIRAFFIQPDWARHGIGKALLNLCEDEARRFGFKSAQLVATLTGAKLYSVFGYSGAGRIVYDLGDGLTIDFIPMKKEKI